MTCQPLFKSLSNIVNHNNFLHINQDVQRTFTPKPMVSHWNACKLRSRLVRAKLYPIEREVSSCKCNGKRCEMYINVLEIDPFTCSNDQTTYKINNQFDCNKECDKFAIIMCNKCLKEYVGQTIDIFRSR